MAECEVSSEISKFEPRDSLNEEVNGEEYENSVVDCIKEYPPLLGQGVLVSSAKSVVEHGRTWVDVLKKPCLHVKAKVNEEKLDIQIVSPHESVASSDASSTITDELGVEKASALLITVPRLGDDDLLKEEKTDLRDATPPFQIKRMIHEHAVDEVTSARDLVKLKHKEIESHLSVIRKVKTALPFDDLDSQEVLEQQLEAEKHLKTRLTVGAQHQKKVDVRPSAISIVQRFSALDECSLSSDEKPDVVPRHVSAVNLAGEDELKGQKLKLLEVNEGGDLLKAQMQMEKREKKREKRLTKKQKKKKKTVPTNNKIWVLILIIMICLVFSMYLIY